MPPFVVGEPGNGDVVNVWMLNQLAFDIVWPHLLATGVDDIAPPAFDMKTPVITKESEITGR